MHHATVSLSPETIKTVILLCLLDLHVFEPCEQVLHQSRLPDLWIPENQDFLIFFHVDTLDQYYCIFN